MNVATEPIRCEVIRIIAGKPFRCVQPGCDGKHHYMVNSVRAHAR